MDVLRRLSHEQLVSTITTRLGLPLGSDGTDPGRSAFVGDPGVSAIRIERYPRTRRAPRPLAPTYSTTARVAPAEATYASFFASPAPIPVISERELMSSYALG